MEKLPLTTQRLATLLADELEKDSWGDVDPYWLRMVGDNEYTKEDDHCEQAEALAEVLDRVVSRLKERFHV